MNTKGCVLAATMALAVTGLITNAAKADELPCGTEIYDLRDAIDALNYPADISYRDWKGIDFKWDQIIQKVEQGKYDDAEMKAGDIAQKADQLLDGNNPPRKQKIDEEKGNLLLDAAHDAEYCLGGLTPTA